MGFEWAMSEECDVKERRWRNSPSYISKLTRTEVESLPLQAAQAGSA